MGNIEQTRAAIQQGEKSYGDAYNQARRSNAETGLAWSALYGLKTALEKTIKEASDVDEALSNSREHNAKAGEIWAKAFAQLIGVGAADSRQEGVVTAVANANHGSELAGERQGPLDANHEKVQPFVATLRGMLEIVDDMIPEVRGIERGSEEFLKDQGPVVAGKRALWEWERGL